MADQNTKMSWLRKIYTVRNALLVVTGAALASCGGSGSAKGPPQLHLACQTVVCECRDAKTELFADRKTTDIVWRTNGDATCPKGFVLERVVIDFLGRRK